MLDKNAAVFVLGADVDEEQPCCAPPDIQCAAIGANLIVSNGRITRLNEYAKHSIVYNFGDEAYFLLGMLRTILDEKLESKEFIAARINGFEPFKKSLQPYKFEKCAERCHVKPEKIRDAARLFAQSRDGLILLGREMMAAMQRDAAVESAIAALLLVTGHVGRANNGLIALST
jgi:formate dehydrogenase major subunit